MNQKLFYKELSTLLSIWRSYGQKRDSRSVDASSIPIRVNLLVSKYTGFRMDIEKKEKGNTLSFMEMLCLILFSLENDRKKVAQILNIKPSSTEEYENRIRQKLGVDSRLKTFRVALENGYVSLTPKSQRKLFSEEDQNA